MSREETYESGNRAYWCNKLDITPQALTWRIKKYGSLQKAVEVGNKSKAAMARSIPKAKSELESYLFNTIVLGISHETHTALRLKVKKHRAEIRRNK